MTGLLGIGYQQYIFGSLVFSSGVCSLNYWRVPGPSMRRDLDYILAGLALGYAVIAGFCVRGVLNILAWVGFVTMFFLFRHSWFLSVGDGGDGTWACWHAAAHVSAAIAGAFQALGGVDGWLQDLSLMSVRDNLPGTLGVALLVTVLAYDHLQR